MFINIITTDIGILCSSRSRCYCIKYYVYNMIYISFHFFHSQISSWNAAGITITVVGAALYSVAKLADDNVERRRAKAAKNVARFKHDDDGILNDPSIPSVVLNTDEDMHRRLVSHV